MTWREFVGLVEELPATCRFWRAVWEPFEKKERLSREVAAQHEGHRKRLGLSPPPSFRHRSRV